MKHLFLSFCLFVLSAMAFPTFAADWSLVSRNNTQTLRSIMMDGTNLVAVGNRGSVFVSADNGATWNAKETNTTPWLFGQTVMPNGDLFVVGEGGTGIISSDHGKTWTQINLGVSGNLHAISVKNNYGYIVGAGGIFLQRNASTNTWSVLSLGTTDDFYGVQDLGDGTGWIVGANGDVYHLTLGGLSHAKIVLTSRETFRAVKFTDATNGWIVGTQGTILRSIDGGATWSAVSIAGVTSQTLYSIDASGDHLVIAGDKILITSDDAGKTWNVKSLADTQDTFYGVLAQADGSAFAVGTDYDVASLIFKISASTPLPPPSPSKGEGADPVIGTAVQSSLIKLACSANATVNDPCKAVYFYATDGKRHAFPNDKVYFSWFTDFSTVKEVSASFLASLSLGKNVTYRPGVKMVKFQTSPQVYAVAKGGILRAIASESIAAGLYGSDWNKKIDDISDVFYGDYKFGEPIVLSTDYDPAQARILVGSLSENF